MPWQNICDETVNTSDCSTRPDGIPREAATVPQREQRRALLIGDDQQAAAIFTDALQSIHIESSWDPSGLAGLSTARHIHFDLSFVDLDLPDMPGTTVIDMLRAHDERTRVIVVSASVTASVARTALRAGALGVLGKPFDASDVIAAVQTALGPNGVAKGHGRPPAPKTRSERNPRATPRSVAERWAVLVLNTIQAESDPKTISRWAKSIGVSRSTLCECCRLVHVSPHDARDFARFMRAICRSGQRWEPEAQLDLADARTLKKLFARAGLGDTETTPTTYEFLERQRWIPRSNPGLLTLRTMLFGADITADASR